MNIKLKPVGKKSGGFTFPALPEDIQGKSSAKYQSFDIISQGAVKAPMGTDVEEITWSGEFFGEAKKDEPIVQTDAWKDPVDCVNILKEYLRKGTVLNLIVTGTWINLDVTVASFQPKAYGAFGNIKYSITFAQKKELALYTTKELKISTSKKKKTTSRKKSSTSTSAKTYTVKSGDTLWKIAQKYYKKGSQWTKIYNVNKKTIEAAAKKHGKSSSSKGHWIWPGTKLVIP